VLVGYFSAKQKDHAMLMDSAADALSVVGARIVDRFVQRRGVSHGGVKKMTLPYSSRTLVSSGKAHEIAAACEAADADAVIFLNDLTDHQRRVLSGIFGCPVASISEFPPAV
jgi:50S ribosomal subunit-associated GTPase HflX